MTVWVNFLKSSHERENGLLRTLLARLNAMLLISAMALATFCAGTAKADVWGYVDAKGVAHFSADRLDERYELFFGVMKAFQPARANNCRRG